MTIHADASTDPAAGQFPLWDDANATKRGLGRVRLVLLGWRMSVSTPDARRRLVLGGIGASLAMLVLLLGMGALSAVATQAERVWARPPLGVERTPQDGLGVVSEQTSVSGNASTFRGIEVNTVVAVPIGTPPEPPGLDRFPAAGTIAASPAFAELHASDPLFADRYPGEITAIIGPEGLAGPNEAFAWVSVPDAPVTYPTSGYGQPGGEAVPAGARDSGDLLVPLGMMLFVLPALILVGTATRLGSAQRDQRMAAMRLVGATPGEVRLVCAAEAGTIGGVGVVGGLLLFLVIRPAMGWLPWRPGIFPSDLVLQPTGVVALALALPLLGVLAGYLSQRRVVATPLGITRRSAPRAPRPGRLIPLGIGLSMLAVLALRPQLVEASNPAPLYVLLFGGAACTLLGLVLASPLVGYYAAAALLRIRRLPVAGTLGARRVQADPGTAARLVTGSTVLVFIATWVLATFVPVFVQASTGYLDEIEAALAPGIVTGTAHLGSVDRLRAIPGVGGVAPVVLAEPASTTQEDDNWPGNAGLVDCATLAPMLREPLRDPLESCTAGAALPVWSEPTDEPVRVIDLIAQRDLRVDSVAFEGAGSVADGDGAEGSRRNALSELTDASYLLPASNVPADLPVDWGVRMVVATDGSPEAVESVKTVMAQDSGVVPRTRDDERHATLGDQRATRVLMLCYLLAIGLMAAVSLAVAAIDDLRTRSRAVAALAAAGTSVSTLRWASLIQLALTLIPATLLALAAATAGGWTYSELALVGSVPGTARPFDPTVVAAVGVGGVLIVLAAYALTLPALRSAVDLRGMRTG